jgi:hypothetical protein
MFCLAAAEDQIATLLSETVSWSFDVFQLAKLCPGRVMTTLGLKLLQDHDLYNALGIEQDAVARFFGGIEAAYNPNPYHNGLHGADVGVTMNSLLTTGGMRAWMTPLQIFAALVSAFAHDVVRTVCVWVCAHPAFELQAVVGCRHILA